MVTKDTVEKMWLIFAKVRVVVARLASFSIVCCGHFQWQALRYKRVIASFRHREKWTWATEGLREKCFNRRHACSERGSIVPYSLPL